MTSGDDVASGLGNLRSDTVQVLGTPRRKLEDITGLEALTSGYGLGSNRTIIKIDKPLGYIVDVSGFLLHLDLAVFDRNLSPPHFSPF